MVGVAVTGDARTAVLGRVRTALGASPEVPEVPRDYRGVGGRDEGDAVEVFAERCADYAATVHRTNAAGVDALVAELVGEGRVLTPELDGGTLSTQELDGFDVVATGCAVAIAETGTIVLDGGEASGRRAITLVPDHHVCIVRADQVVPGVPDAIAAVRDAVDDGRPLTFVSGPSATSDIELERVEGVHGPRRLDVLLVS